MEQSDIKTNKGLFLFILISVFLLVVLVLIFGFLRNKNKNLSDQYAKPLEISKESALKNIPFGFPVDDAIDSINPTFYTSGNQAFTSFRYNSNLSLEEISQKVSLFFKNNNWTYDSNKNENGIEIIKASKSGDDITVTIGLNSTSNQSYVHLLISQSLYLDGAGLVLPSDFPLEKDYNLLEGLEKTIFKDEKGIVGGIVLNLKSKNSIESNYILYKSYLQKNGWEIMDGEFAGRDNVKYHIRGVRLKNMVDIMLGGKAGSSEIFINFSIIK